MGIFPDSWMGFFVSKSTDYNSEIEKIRNDVAKILDFMEKLGTNQKSVEFNQGKFDLLEDPDFHPVAKLVAIYPNALETINQYISNLELAGKGDNTVANYLEETKNDINKIIEKQIKLFKVSLLDEEANKVLFDQEAVMRLRESLFPKDNSDPDQKIPWYEERIKILNDESLDLVARLSFSRRYDKTVSMHIQRLRLASQGDKSSLLKVAEDKVKALNLIALEIRRMKEKLESWKEKKETLESAGTSKWFELKRQVKKECDEERALFELSFPKDEKDMLHWRTYYQKRVSRLELDALSPFARLIWVKMGKMNEVQDFVIDYFHLIDRMILGEPFEENLHELESKAEAIVKSEAARLRQQYPQFFLVAV